MLYTFGRFSFENLRIDPAHHVAGLRINTWVSIGVFLATLTWFLWLGAPRRSSALLPCNGALADR